MVGSRVWCGVLDTKSVDSLIQAGKWRLDGKFVDEVLKVEFRRGAFIGSSVSPDMKGFASEPMVCPLARRSIREM